MIVAILQARMSSRRLPGKVLKPILGEPMLLRQIERIQRSRLIDCLVVATSDELSDDAIVKIFQDNQMNVFRGSLDNVLDRYYQAAALYDADHIIRLTADCPLTDPELIDQVVQMHLNKKNDYTSNICPPTFPDGLDVEVFTFAALEKTRKSAKQDFYQEHVTSYIRDHTDQFQLGNYQSQDDRSDLRWTVDEEADFKLVSEIYSRLYPNNPDFKTDDIFQLLKTHPEISTLNAHLERA